MALHSNPSWRAERKSRSRETALSKTDVMIPRLPLPHKRFFSSLVFTTVAHSASSLGISLQPLMTVLRVEYKDEMFGFCCCGRALSEKPRVTWLETTDDLRLGMNSSARRRIVH